VDGYFAVRLWDDYQGNENIKALETLLAYNIHDVVSLQTLMVLSHNLKLRETPFNETHQLASPPSDGQIACHYTHLPKGFNLKDISKL
jgi:hypothetical protein